MLSVSYVHMVAKLFHDSRCFPNWLKVGALEKASRYFLSGIHFCFMLSLYNFGRFKKDYGRHFHRSVVFLDLEMMGIVNWMSIHVSGSGSTSIVILAIYRLLKGKVE